MIGVLTPLEETVSGKELIAKGVKIGEKKAEKRVLTSFYEEGLISKAQYEQRMKNLKP